MTAELEKQLKEIDLSPIVAHENGLTVKVRAKLTSRVKGLTTEEELENFLAQKLNLTSLNLDKLETQEYPQSAVKIHGVLHTAFVLYEEALLALEDFLWRGEETGASLEEIFSVLHQGDRYLQSFQGELDDQLAPMAGINTLG